MKRTITTMLCLLVLLGAARPADEAALLGEAAKRVERKEFAAAARLVDECIRRYGESEKSLAARFQLLLAQNRPDEALPVAVRRSRLAARKTPWHCLDVAAILLQLQERDAAINWISRAVERGLLEYGELREPAYAALRGDPRFEGLVARVRAAIGIGRAPRPLAVELLEGGHWDLAAQRGKVVLIDFWATWCPPCREGFVHLRDFYGRFRGRGFEIIGIGLDARRQDAVDYQSREKLPWRLSCSGRGWLDETARRYSVNLIPSYWLVDRRGILRDFGMQLRDRETMRRAIEALLAEP